MTVAMLIPILFIATLTLAGVSFGLGFRLALWARSTGRI